MEVKLIKRPNNQFRVVSLVNLYFPRSYTSLPHTIQQLDVGACLVTVRALDHTILTKGLLFLRLF